MILGINLSHDYAYCLIDGDRIYLREIERVSRLRYHWNDSSLTLSLLDDFSVEELKQITAIYLNSPEIWDVRRNSGDLSSVNREYYYVGDYLTRDLNAPVSYGKIHVEGMEIPAAWVAHAYAHAASTFWTSPYENADIIVLDGGSDTGYGGWMTGSRQHIEMQDIYRNVKVGNRYHRFSQIVYQANSGFYESKVMAIASYGNKDLSKRQYLKKNGMLNTFPDKKVCIHDIAKFQYDFEQAVMNLIKRGKTDNEYLCCAGGCFFNVGLNRVIADSGLYKGVFVPSFAGDMGTALGSALYGCLDMGTPMPSPQKLRNPFLGDPIKIELNELEKLIENEGDEPVISMEMSAVENGCIH